MPNGPETEPEEGEESGVEEIAEEPKGETPKPTPEIAAQNAADEILKTPNPSNEWRAYLIGALFGAAGIGMARLAEMKSKGEPINQSPEFQETVGGILPPSLAQEFARDAEYAATKDEQQVGGARILIDKVLEIIRNPDAALARINELKPPNMSREDYQATIQGASEGFAQSREITKGQFQEKTGTAELNPKQKRSVDLISLYLATCPGWYLYKEVTKHLSEEQKAQLDSALIEIGKVALIAAIK